MQHKIARLNAVIAKECDYLMSRMNFTHNQIFSGLVRKLVEGGRYGKSEIYDKSKQTVDLYTDCWQTRLKDLRKLVVNVLVPETFAVKAASGVTPALETYD